MIVFEEFIAGVKSCEHFFATNKWPDPKQIEKINLDAKDLAFQRFYEVMDVKAALADMIEPKKIELLNYHQALHWLENGKMLDKGNLDELKKPASEDKPVNGGGSG